MQMGTPKSEFCISDFFDNDTTSSNPNMSDFLKKASKFFSGSNGGKKKYKTGEKGHDENEENRKENDGDKEEKKVETVNVDEENNEKWGKKLKNRGKLFVGGLNPGTTAQNLEIYFSRFGKVVDSVVMKCPKTSKSRGFGFVTFADPANAEMALQANHTLDGKVIETRPFGKKKPENRVFLGGVSQTVKEKDLKEFFSRYGEVTSVDIVNDRITKKPKGFAFLAFKDPEAVEKCLSESFVHIGGKRVDIRKAEQRDESKVNDDASVPDLSREEEDEEDFDVEQDIFDWEDAASMVDDETRSSSSGGQWSVFDQVPRFQKLFEDYILSKTGNADKENNAETKEWNENAEKEVADVEKLLMNVFLNSGLNVGKEEEEENLIVFSTDEETSEEGTSDGDSSSDELDDILDGTSNRYLTGNDAEFSKTFLGKGEGDGDSSRNSPNLFIKKGSLWCSLCQWQPPDGSKESFFAHCQTPAHRLKTQERFSLKQNQGSKPEAKSILTTAATARSKSLEKLLIGESDSEEEEKLKTKQKKNPKEPQMKQQKQPQQKFQQKRLQQDQTQQKEKQQQEQEQLMELQQKQQLQLQKAKQKQKQPQEQQQKKQKQPQEQQQKKQKQPQEQQQKQQKQPQEQQQKKQKQPQEQQQKQQKQPQEQQQQKQKQPQEQQQQDQPRKNVQQKQLQQKKEQQNKTTENTEEGKTKQGGRNISNLKIHALAKGMVSIRPLSGNLLQCTMCGKTIPQAQSFDILMKNLSQHLQSKKHLSNLSATEISLKNALEENQKQGKESSSIRNSNNNVPACTTNGTAGKVKRTQEHSKVRGELSLGEKPQGKRRTPRKQRSNEKVETGVANDKKEKTDKGSGANCENTFLCLHCEFRSGRGPFRAHLKSKSHSDCLRGRGVSSDDFLNSRNVCPGCRSVLFGSLYGINQHYSGCLRI